MYICKKSSMEASRDYAENMFGASYVSQFLKKKKEKEKRERMMEDERERLAELYRMEGAEEGLLK